MSSAAELSLEDICGAGNLQLFNSFFNEVDASKSGLISSKLAASYLKRSQLNNAVLAKIWDVADYKNCGMLDKQGFFIALKLIALAQNGIELSIENVQREHCIPNLTGAGSRPVPSFEEEAWAVTAAEQEKYDKIFQSLTPQSGKLTGDQVKPVLLNSGLPTNVLGKIWEVSDIDKDGLLDREEMIVALHLVYKALQNEGIPNALPRSLVPPSKRHLLMGGTMPRKASLGGGSAVSVLPPPPLGLKPRSRASSLASLENVGMSAKAPISKQSDILSLGPSNSVVPSGGSRSLTTTPLPYALVHPPSAVWIVDSSQWEGKFAELDTNHDGLVSGDDVKHVFLETGLSQLHLAHIWNLCDIKQNGLFNTEQFALAMHLIQQKKAYGQEPPPVLPPELVPPTFRPSPAGMTDIGTEPLSHGSSVMLSQFEPSGNPEIDEIRKEIEELRFEHKKLDSDVIQLEADLTIKNSEIKNLEVELSTLKLSTEQLGKQQQEAQRRLTDLDAQKNSLEDTLKEIFGKIEKEQTTVGDLQKNIQLCAGDLQKQEQALNSKRMDLQNLREEESKLEVTLQMEKERSEQTHRMDTDLERKVELVLSQIAQLKEYNETVKSKMEKLDAILESGDYGALERDSTTLLQRSEPISIADVDSVFPDVATSFADSTNFAEEDPFGNEADPFALSTTNPSSFQGFGSPSFGDPFSGVQSNDAFQNFPTGNPSTVNSTGAHHDPFVPDPPVLPPKNAQMQKQPPPRPAPPKNRPITPKHDQASSGISTPSDPWGASSNAGSTVDPWGAPTAKSDRNDGFADFADFSSFS